MKSATRYLLLLGTGDDVSIHALMKSATCRFALNDSCTDVSIHALMKSATVCFSAYFPAAGVSIHALMKSATVPSWRIVYCNVLISFSAVLVPVFKLKDRT